MPRLIDPNASAVRAQSKELRDLMIAARKSWLMAYDNITTLPTWLSSGLFVRAYTDEQNRSVPPHQINPQNRHDRHVETRSAAQPRRRTAQPRR